MFGIVVVAYNSAGVLGDCLRSCLQTPGAEVVVVDNASTDESVSIASAFPGVRVVRHAANLGFAAAANRGIAELTSALILILNPDVRLLSGMIELAQAARQRGVGAVSGRLLNEDGSVQQGFQVRAFPTPLTLCFEVLGLNALLPWNPVNRRYRFPHFSAGIAGVDQPPGAFLLIRRDAWERIGGFDEQFHPVWFEDVDFCLRLRSGGHRILHVPSATAVHCGGHSVRNLPWARKQETWYRNLLRYSCKHFSFFGRAAVALSVMAASLLRAGFAALQFRNIVPFRVYSKIIRLAAHSFSRSGPKTARLTLLTSPASAREKR